MSSSVLPVIPGIAFPVQRTPVWDTNVQTNMSGKEVRIANDVYPRWRWELSYNILRSAAAYTEFQTLVGFFNARQGRFDTFLYEDPDDKIVTGQSIGRGDGVTTIFSLVRTLGGFIEPILAPKAVSSIYLGGIAYNPAIVPPPGACALSSQAGGALGATTYYVKAVWNTPTGQTLAGSESSLSVAANRQLVVNPPLGAPAGATGWTPYVSNTASGGSGAEQYQGSGALGLASSWTEPTSGLIAGGALPVANTTGARITYWGGGDSEGPGVLAFNGAPGNGIAITVDMTYYWPCRFDMDSADFSLFMSQFYALKKLSFISVKN